MGASHRQLGVPGEEDLCGMGVSYCATCDGAFFKNRDVAVVGGGDVALEDALFLARGCRKVYLIHRRDAFRGAKVLQKQVEEKENIVCVMDSVVDEIVGEDMVEKVCISNKKTQQSSELSVQGIFIAVGISPNTKDIQGLPKQDDAGYIIAAVMGLVLPTTRINADGVEYTKAWVLNWDKVADAAWFSVPKLMPVKLVFDWRAIIPVLIMFVVTAVETVGDISGVMEGGMGREATDKELSGGVICDGIGSSLAALFGVLPNTSFSQNVGLVTMTKIVNRMALASGAVFLILCGLFPKLAALISIMPQSVLGGAAVMMFSSIVISGIQLITKEPMTMRNITIVSVALGLGYGIGSSSGILAHLPQGIQLIFGGSGIVPAAIVAIIFNIILPKDAE
jgi:hypothetical protein